MENASTQSAQPPWLWDVFVGLLPLLALSPMLLLEIASLWSRDHMQFFTLVIGLLALLVAFRFGRAQESRHPIRVWTAVSILLLAMINYAYAVWIYSPWLAHLSLILVFLAWALGHFGQRHWAGVAAWTALLATTLPLPRGWDLGFSTWLQTLAAWCSAKALDAIGVPCLQNGSLIEIRDLQIVADEICGGLGSVYAFAAFAIALAVLQHNSLIVALKTLFLVPLWTVLGYFLRMFGMLALREFTGRDYSSGWDFRILEGATALIVLFLIWASSRLLMRIFEPIPVGDAEFGPIFSGLNKAFCWPQPDPFEDVEPEDHYEKMRFRERKEERLAKQRAYADFLWTKNRSALWTVRIAAGLLLVCAVLPLGGLASQGLSNLNFGRPTLTLAQIERLGNADSLPVELEGGWKQIGFQVIQRNPRSRKGEFGLTWHYANNARNLSAELDLPFLGWNNPANELELQGWTTESMAIKWRDDWAWGECDLENELGGKATMFYSLLTPDGQPYNNVPPRLDADGEAALGDTPERSLSSQSASAVTYQFQLISETGVELSSEDQETLRQKFLQLRESARSLLK